MLKVQWINGHEVSGITGRAVQTLRNDRHRRKGLPYCKVGASVHYKLGDLEQFMDTRRITFDR